MSWRQQALTYLDLLDMKTGYIININHKNYENVRVEGKKLFEPVSY